MKLRPPGTTPKGSASASRQRHGRDEVVAGGAVDGEIAHRTELDRVVFVAPGSPAGPIHRRELVQARGMALHAQEAVQVGVVRLEMHSVPNRVGDQTSAVSKRLQRSAPLSVMATTEGVKRKPCAFVKTLVWSPSMSATTELVVPRSIPMIFDI